MVVSEERRNSKDTIDNDSCTFGHIVDIDHSDVRQRKKLRIFGHGNEKVGDWLMGEKQGLKILVIIIISLIGLIIFMLITYLIKDKSLPLVEMIKKSIGGIV